MSYKSRIEKTELDVIAELYEIIIGSDAFYLTSYFENITYANKTYTSAIIERSELGQEAKEKTVLNVSFLFRESILEYIFAYTIPKLFVKIRRYFLNTGESKLIFVGQGDVVGGKDLTVTIYLTDFLESLKINIPVICYQHFCNNVLFDGRCGLNQTDYERNAYVLGSGSTLTSATFGGFADNYFAQGLAKYKNEFRLITGHSKNAQQIYLHYPFDENVDGKWILVYPGCDKTARTCRDKFNNLANFAGFPYIPARNPVIWGL